MVALDVTTTQIIGIRVSQTGKAAEEKDVTYRLKGNGEKGAGLAEEGARPH